MATRSHIRFIQGDKKIQVFKFHDGHPDYMTEFFNRFFKLVRNLDIDEIVPTFITFGKLDCHEEKTIKEFLNDEWKPICLEIYLTETTDDIPSDIEYFYHVDLDQKTIFEQYTKTGLNVQMEPKK